MLTKLLAVGAGLGLAGAAAAVSLRPAGTEQAKTPVVTVYYSPT